MAEFMVDIGGRINNTRLPDSKYLWALLESVVNSIQSIEEAAISDGRIEIYAQRQDHTQTAFDMKESNVRGVDYKPEVASYESFAVMDNGHGFTTENYRSFLTADSSLKWKKGCKGIGRFLWLKSFEGARIESTFIEEGKWHKRTFDFTIDGITPDDNIASADLQKQKTTVTLSGFKKQYRERCPKSLEILARNIIEHCLIYFLLDTCPRIVIRSEERRVG